MQHPPVSPPLTASELAMAEDELGVSFPAAYRACLMEEKPAERVVRPRRREWGWDWGADRSTPARLLTLPFPHPDSYVKADAALAAREPRPEDFADEQAHEEAWRAWDEECEDFEDRKTAGAVVLQDNGCGFYTLLAVTGPLAGTVWWDGRATCDLIVPLSLDHAGGARPVTFSEWLRHGSWDLLPPGWGPTDVRAAAVRENGPPAP
ncbi:SMI1/KNR4 family protein [Streptomyces kurssanovii]|uniref:SMI1/KNR4 family protein n=1 Tax=Streptomyces kurssanovii TaxID=67312 RepID=A0ABV3HPP5_9ACTN